jgi:type IV pilus assembly protein PilV
MSLIEVLVSMVILSLGVLAVVALQLVSKRNNADAGQRTVAAQLAYDMIERMRANSFAAALDAYRTTTTNPIGKVGGLEAAPTGATTCDSSGTQCTSTELVAFDRYEWEQALLGAAEQISGAATGGLLFPTGCVTGPAGGGDGQYTVTIAWRGSIELPDNAAVTCGSAASDGGVRIYGNSDEYRRTVQIEIFITARRRQTT